MGNYDVGPGSLVFLPIAQSVQLATEPPGVPGILAETRHYRITYESMTFVSPWTQMDLNGLKYPMSR